MLEENHRIWGAGVVGAALQTTKGRGLIYREKFWVDSYRKVHTHYSTLHRWTKH